MVRHRIVQPVLDLLTQGITPEKIALSLACGAVLGLCPLLGCTTFVCTVLALGFGLNLPAIQLANYGMYPLQLALLLPLVRLGDRLTHSAPQPLALAQILTMVKTDHLHALRLLWTAALHATLAWIVIGIPAGLLLYFGLRPVMATAASALEKRKAQDASTALS